jgi:hypothetical protein
MVFAAGAELALEVDFELLLDLSSLDPQPATIAASNTARAAATIAIRDGDLRSFVFNFLLITVAFPPSPGLAGPDP